MTFTKVGDHVAAYPMPFAECLYAALFSRSQGGGGAESAPPPDRISVKKAGQE